MYSFKLTQQFSANKLKPAEFKPKKVGTKTAHTIFILDDSSSMQYHRSGTISGFNEFLDVQKNSEIPTKVSLYKFNGSHVTPVISYVDAKAVEPLTSATYNPMGSTNLLDAVGTVLRRVNELNAGKKKEKRDMLQIVVLTDGEENSSREYTNEMIKGMIHAAEEKNWTFMFLGANVDAFSVGGGMGFRTSNTLQYDTSNIGQTVALAGQKTELYKTSVSRGMSAGATYDASSFTDDERNSVK